MEYNDMPVGVNAIIVNEKKQILLGKRKNCFGAGKFSLIGGKLKKGETIELCIIRELREEIGIEVDVDDVEVVNVATTNLEIPMIQIGVFIKKYTGKPHNKENKFCEEIEFFSIDNLPELFAVTKTNLLLYLDDKFYDRRRNI